MAEKLTFLQRKYGRGYQGANVEVSNESIAPEPQFQGYDLNELLSRAREGTSDQIVDLLTQRGVTSEEIAQARAFLDAHPGYASEYRAQLAAGIEKMQRMRPDQIAATIRDELQALSSPTISEDDLKRFERDGILIPAVIPVNMMQSAVREKDLRADVAKTAGKKIGKVKKNKPTERLAYVAGAATITGVATWADYQFSKDGFGKFSDGLINQLGLEEAMKAIGNGAYETYQSLISLAVERGAPLTEAQQLLLGRGLAATVLTGLVLGYIFYSKMVSPTVRDAINPWKHPVRGTLTLGTMGLVALIAVTGMDERAREAPASGILAGEIDKRWTKRAQSIKDAGTKVAAIPQKMQQPIDRAVQTAFETGTAKTGPLTVASWLSLRGNTKDAKGRLIGDRFLRDMGSAPGLEPLQQAAVKARDAVIAARKAVDAAKGDARAIAEERLKKAEEDLEKAESQLESFSGTITLSDSNKKKSDAIFAAINTVNKLEKYRTLGMKEGDGASQLVQYLTGSLPMPKSGEDLSPLLKQLTAGLTIGDEERDKLIKYFAASIPKSAGELVANFEKMIESANRKKDIGPAGAFFGDMSLSRDLPFAELYDLQKDYPMEVVAVLRRIVLLNRLTEYLKDVQRELERSAQTKLNLNIPIEIPDLGFSEAEILRLVIPEKGEGYNFQNVLHPTWGDTIANAVWGTEEAWQMRDAVFKKGNIPTNMQESFWQKALYTGVKDGAYLFFILFSILLSGKLVKSKDRIDEEDLDKDVERIHQREDELIGALVGYAEAFNADIVGKLNRGGAAITSGSLANDAFRKHVAFVLRREILSSMPDPRESGKTMAASPDGIAFMHQSSKRFDPSGEYSRTIRNGYVQALENWADRLKQDPFEIIKELLAKVDPQFQTTADALVKFNAANPGTKERDQALKSLLEAFKTREKEILSAEATQLEFAKARLEARAEAIHGLVGDKDDRDIVLDGSDPKLTEKNMVAVFMLPDISGEIAALQDTIAELVARGATITPPDPDQVRLTQAEWDREREAFMQREREMLVRGSGVSGDASEMMRQINAFVGSISKGIQPIKNELEAYLKTINPDASVSFEYTYSHQRKGPTIAAIFTDARNPDQILEIPFLHKIPSAEMNTSEKALQGIRDWAKVDGPLAQRLRVNALFDNNRNEFNDALRKVEAFSTSLQAEQDAVAQNADTINTLFRSRSIMNAQLPLMKKLSDGTPLTNEELLVFTDPQRGIPEMWKGSITTALDRATRRGFRDLTGKRIIVALDQNLEGFLAAVPADAQLPVNIATLPGRDVMSILRAMTM